MLIIVCCGRIVIAVISQTIVSVWRQIKPFYKNLGLKSSKEERNSASLKKNLRIELGFIAPI